VSLSERMTQAGIRKMAADGADSLRHSGGCDKPNPPPWSLWREPGMRPEKWMAYQSDKIARALSAFEPAPPEEICDVGTIALACALGYLDLRFEGAWRTEHPRLVSWLDVFSDATPSFEATRFRG